MAPLLPPATLGLLGGGQLGRYFLLAARELGYRVWVLDPDPDSPAGHLANRHLCAGYEDAGALAELASGCRAVTTEFENVPAASLDLLARTLPVHPAASAVAVCQNRIAEKDFLARHSLPIGPCLPVRNADDLAGAGPELFPGILKTARLGYDGKGQVPVADRDRAQAAFAQLGGGPCLLEQRLPLDLELSVVLARDAGGRLALYPPAENRHRDGILDVSIVPARVSPALAAEAAACAGTIAGALGFVGTLAIEFFVSGGRLLVNELAPRPHNSGHWTLDGALTSQYEQQVRALCGLPLGDPTPLGTAVMVNLLGDLWPAGGEPDWQTLLAIPDLKLHLYGKHAARPGRKMGHFTLVGPALPPLLDRVAAVRQALGLPP